MINKLISPTLSDETYINDKEETVYSHDCHNLPICSSYGESFTCCLAGAYGKNRCSHAEKMFVRILNDTNPNAIYKPQKPSEKEINDYVKDQF